MTLNKSVLKNMALLLVATVSCLLVAEIVVRIIYKDTLRVWKDERNLTYRHDSYLGWFPVENSVRKFKGSRLIEVKHNRRGFRDIEHVLGAEPRIVFLGDSFVWGYDVNQGERFTDKLRQILPDVSIYNLGVSGYGTDQEYLLLQKNFDFYKPNIVFVVFCTENDWVDNSRSRRYGGYYKPYFFIKGNDLELQGIPVPKVENYFLIKHDILSKSYLVQLAVKTIYNAFNPQGISFDNPTYIILEKMHEMSIEKGFQLIIGLQGNGPKLEDFLEYRKIPYINLNVPHRYPSDGGHWTPEGHSLVARRIYEYLTKFNYLTATAELSRDK